MNTHKAMMLQEYCTGKTRFAILRRWGLPQPGAGARLLAMSACSKELMRGSIDPNEEKVKCVPQQHTRLPPSSLKRQLTHPSAAQTAPSSCPQVPEPAPGAGMLPTAAVAGTVAGGLIAPSHAQAAIMDSSLVLPSTLQISYGPPNDFLPHLLLQHQQEAQAAVAAASAAQPAGGVNAVVDSMQEGGEQLLQHFAAQASTVQADVQDSVGALQHRVQQGVQGAVDAVSHASSQVPASASHAYSHGMTTMHQLANSLAASMADWPITPQAMQVASYCAAAAAVLLLLRGGAGFSAQPTSVASSSTAGTRTDSNTASKNTRHDRLSSTVTMRTLKPAATARHPSSWGKSQAEGRQPQPPAARATSPIKEAREASPSPWPETAGSVTDSQARAALNPVQAAWQHFRSGAVARAITPTPMRASARPQDGTLVSDQQRSVSAEPMELRSLRSSLKEQLAAVCEALGPLLSVVPAGDDVRPQADELLLQLEKVAPSKRVGRVATTVKVPEPLFDASLLGSWQLMYASNSPQEPQLHTQASTPVPTATTSSGNVVPNVQAGDPHVYATRSRSLSSAAPVRSITGSTTSSVPPSMQSPSQISAALRAGSSGGGVVGVLMHLVAALPAGCGLQHVDQQLEVEGDQPTRTPRLKVTNSATLSLGPLGVWCVETRGYWQQAAAADATSGAPTSSRPWKAWFESLALQPIELLGQNTMSTLPQVVVALPPQLQGTSDWVTTYVDDNTRITRGAGAVFLFKRVPSNQQARMAGRNPHAGIHEPFMNWSQLSSMWQDSM